MGWVKYSTVGAKAGTDLKDSSGNVLADTAVKNSAVSISAAGALSGAGGGTVAIGSLSGSSAYQNSQISISAAGALSGAGGGTVAIGSLSGSSGYNNQSITVNTTTGILENIGTGSIKVNNAKQDWQDVSGTGIPADGATVGAVFGTNLYKSGTTNFTAAEIKNANQDYSDVVGTKPPSDATKGAVFGTNLYSTGTTNFTAAELKNSSITLNAAGYLNNIGTTEKVKNALVEINTDGTLNYAGGGSGAVSKAGLSLDYDDGATVGAIAGTNLKAANGTTNLGDNDIKNTALDVAITGTAIKLKIGATETSTVTASQALVGLSGVSNNADQTSSNTANNTANVGDKTVAQAQARLGFLNNTGEFAGSLAAAQFPMRGAITAANAGLARSAIEAGPDLTVSGGGTVHADNYTNTTYTFAYGDIVVTEGGAAAAFVSYDNGSNYIAMNKTGTISITHPSTGTYTVDYEWADLDGDNLDGFTLSNATAGSTWSASTFVAGTSESITVTHAESDPDKTIVMSAVTIKHNYGSGGGGGGGCFLPTTPVEMVNGKTKAIEEMEIGDKVRGGTVLNKQAYQVDSWYQLGLHYQHSALNLTAGHPVWIEDKGWSCIEPEEYYKECKEFEHRVDVKPEKIEVGDKTTAGEIKFIEKFYNKQEVWNITVDNEHTYYVNGILVHNGSKE